MRIHVLIAFILIFKLNYSITFTAQTCPGPINWNGTSTANSFNAANSIWYNGGVQLTAQPAAGSVLLIPAGCTVVINAVSCTINNNITLQIAGTLKFKAGGIGILLFNNPATILVTAGGSISSAGTNGASEITLPGGDKYQATMGVATGPFILNNGCKLNSVGPPQTWSPAGCGITLLPIELLEFKGTCLTNAVQLNWSTASELNNDYFLIEKSNDGYMWEKIAKIKGLVNSYAHTKYVHVDYTSQNNLNYYRMSQVDIGGITTIFKAIDVYCSDKDVKDQMVLFPNPSSNELNVILNVNSMANNTIISLVNNTGQLIFENKVNLIKGVNSFTFPVDVASGSYTILCSSENVVIPAQKLIIVKP